MIVAAVPEPTDRQVNSISRTQVWLVNDTTVVIAPGVHTLIGEASDPSRR